MAVMLGSLILGATYSSYITQNRVYTVQNQLAEMNQSARAAMNLMVREVRMAGYDPIGTGIKGIVGADAAPNQIHFIADLDSNGSACDANEDITYFFDSANNRIMKRTTDCGGSNNDQVFIDNVTVFDIRYGLDVNSDGTIVVNGAAGNDDEILFNKISTGTNDCGTEDCIGNNAGDTVTTNGVNDFLQYIQITVTVRTEKEDPLYKHPVNNNGFRTATLTTFIKPRNIGL